MKLAPHLASAAAAAAAVLGGLTSAAASTSNQAGSPFNGGTFQQPSSLVRPRFRYWLPDSSVDPDVLKADIASAGSIGAGGVELLPFFQYGGAIGSIPPGADWSASNFGTPQFAAVFGAALEAHRDHGLVMDFAIGPNQGQGVPARADDEGLQWDLVPFSAAVGADGVFRGVLPGWGTGELVSVVTAAVVSQKTIRKQVISQLRPVNVTHDQYVLRRDSLVERTAAVSATGEISLTLPVVGASDSAAVHHYRLFAFYQRLSLHKNLEFNTTKHTTIFDNGSFVVDHFSSAGARVVAKFWDDHILTDSTRELLAKVGNYAWEDSVEISSNVSWSKSLAARFHRVNGYRIEPFLPLLTFEQNNLATQPESPGPFQCFLDSPDQGAGYVNDFHAALVDGYREYLESLTNWTNTALKTQFSAQTAYNLPLDMLATVPSVDAPECESLAFADTIDFYRQFSGPANLAGRRVISNEMGAVQMEAYRYLVSSLLFSVNRAFAGGVNQIVLHGQSYTGNYYATTWPGYTAFGYLFSEMYSDKQPSWDHGLADVLGYMGRTQLVQQSGVPRVDVAVYGKQSVSMPFVVGYGAADLQEDGWSYSYISPDNFNLPQATVRDGVLGPDGPAWQAVVVQSSQNLTLDAVSKLQQYAAAGLPVILSGGLPGYHAQKYGGTATDFSSRLSTLISSSANVHQVAAGGVAKLLSSLGLKPRVRARTDGTWYTTWRESTTTAADGDDVDYALVYCDLAPASGEIVVSSTKKPYLFNAWTGERTPVLMYKQDGSSTTIPLSMAGNQTVIIAFSNNKLGSEIPTPSSHIVSAPPSVIGADFNNKTSAGISLHVVGGGGPGGNVTLSDGASHAIPETKAAAPFALTNWTLVAEHWSAPVNISDVGAVATKHNTTHVLPSSSPLLPPWSAIPGLANASGVGYYTTRFRLPEGAAGAYVSLPGPIPHTARLLVNGVATPPLDLMAPTVDVTPYLLRGEGEKENEVTVVVATPLWNYLRTVLPELSNAGAWPIVWAANTIGLLEVPGPVEAGLVGEVRVVPFVVEGLAAE